ncbi:MAG TPA: hypothetical protein DIT99_15710 [Candidatus Latescibacteria bacterium]|nr:hypothetical protein [Candidatus Latescibacterota bacterium]
MGVLSDHCASLCLTATKRGAANLRREGIAPQRIRLAGDPLVDFFHTVNPIDYPLPFNTSATESAFCLVVIHSHQKQTTPSGVVEILTALEEIQRPLVCIVDPKMMHELEKMSWEPPNRLNVHVVSSYWDYLGLLLRCERCLTNSPDVMREAYLAHRLCLILDPNPWWPELMETGWAIPISTHGTSLSQAIDHVPLPDDGSNYLLGEKNISENIVQELTDFFSGVDSQTVSWSHHGPSHVLPKSDKTDLTFMNYRHQIHQFLAHDYLFVSFPEAPLLLNKQQRFLIMRHDIDFDLKRALCFAEMEAELGVKSTYFFLLRTDHYNVFSREGTDIVNRILGLGHDMGLHFDCAAYDEDADERSLASACRFEALMLENWFKYPVSIVSYHRPNQLVMTGDAALSYPLLHTYMKIFTMDIQYYSDSRGQWQFGFPSASDAFMQGRPMHILVHPIWWHEQPVPPYQTLLSYVDTQVESLERSIARNCVVYRNGWLKEEI